MKFNMNIKIPNKSASLLAEGVVEVVVRRFYEKTTTKYAMEFAVSKDGKEHLVAKEYKMNASAPSADFLRDCQTVLARPFNEVENQGDFNSTQLEGKACRVVIVHKRVSGGRMAAVVTTVLPQEVKQ
jgi:hypothetical protein